MRKSILLAVALTALAGACGVATAQGASDDHPQHRGPGGMFMQADANHDGVVTRQEFDAGNAAMFARLDKNHDGFLSDDEHPHRGMGGGHRHGGGHGHFGCGFGLERADSNHDGNITRDEFLAGPIERFNHLDANHNGVIEASEMPQRHAREGDGPGPQDQRGHAMNPDADTDHDGRISQAEFAAMGRSMFDRIDANHDGRVTQDEMSAMHHHRGGPDDNQH